MIGLDTNVLVRYLTRDDEAQYRATMTLLCRKGASFFVPDLALVETDWVLSSLYDWTRDEIADAFARLLLVHNLQFEDEDRIRRSLGAVRRGADLSDELLVALCREQKCREFATFDVAVTKRHPSSPSFPANNRQWEGEAPAVPRPDHTTIETTRIASMRSSPIPRSAAWKLTASKPIFRRSSARARRPMCFWF